MICTCNMLNVLKFYNKNKFQHEIGNAVYSFIFKEFLNGKKYQNSI